MKKIFCLLTIAAAICSCGLLEDLKSISEGTDGSFDQYAGMNINDGTPTGKAFEIPTGIKIALVGESGDEESDGKAIADNDRGSGYLVVVSATIQNETDTPCEMKFPAGLIVVSASGEFQNGMLAKETSILVPANSSTTVKLHFYCLNSGRESSISGGDFSFGCITDIDAFDPLFEVCKTKKINIEEHKSSQYITYFTTATRVQDIIWAITKGKTFTKADIEGYLKKVK